MYLYSKIPQFDRNTGKEIEPILKKSGYICDASGLVIDWPNNDAEMLVYTLSIAFDHGSEPAWYEDYYKLKKELHISYGDFSQFMESPFHFKNTEAYGQADVTLNLMAMWIKDVKAAAKKKSYEGFKLSRCGTIEQVLSQVRQETLSKLLKNKEYTLEQLGFIQDEND
jgi:hypothetical protein